MSCCGYPLLACVLRQNSYALLASLKIDNGMFFRAFDESINLPSWATKTKGGTLGFLELEVVGRETDGSTA